MILTGPAIESAIRRGDIHIAPFDKEHLNPNSYNYHLGDTLLALGRAGRPVRQISLEADGHVLVPGTVYLAATRERIGSDRYVTVLLGRSSIGRLGVFLNVTADLGHIGSCSHWTLELTVIQPVRLYANMRIGQVSFWKTGSNSRHRYTGRYHRDSQPVVNRDRRLLAGSHR